MVFYIYCNIIYIIYLLSRERSRMDTSDFSEQRAGGVREGNTEHVWPLNGSVSEGLHRKSALQDRSSGLRRSPLGAIADGQALLEECSSERGPTHGMAQGVWGEESHRDTT